VNDIPCLQIVAVRDDRIADRTSANGAAGFQQLRSALKWMEPSVP
jgi:hypothetical protein